MTEKRQSSADIASRALEEAKARLLPEEFRLFVYMFNVHYLHANLHARGIEPSLIDLMTAGLAQPLIYDYVINNGISEERGEELRLETRQIVIDAMLTAVVPDGEEDPREKNPPGVVGLIIDRARAEGFDVPTFKQIAVADNKRPTGFLVDWDAIYAAERFHFQAVLRRVIDGKPVHMKFMKQA